MPDTYIVLSGDNISIIARKYGIPTSLIISLNGLTNPNSIKIGQVLKLPRLQNSESNTYLLDTAAMKKDSDWKDINLKINESNLALLVDSVNNRPFKGKAQIAAVLANAIAENGVESTPHGNGATGLIGWRGTRAEGLPTTMDGLINTWMNEIFTPMTPGSESWTHGGKGSGYKTAKEAQETFLNADNTDTAMKAITMGNVRAPKDDTRRYKLAKLIEKYLKVEKKEEGGILNAKSGIHIKKKNKGKFTDYCDGKVTEECIQKGKHSSNPAIRKRATFAANARKWHHKEGGLINYLEYFSYGL